MLMPATTTKPGEPYDDLDEVYGRMLGQWSLEMNHVAAIVGGFNSQQKHVGQNGVRFTPIARDEQARAVEFLNANAFKTPSWAIKPDILRRIEPVGVLDRIRDGPAARAQLAAEQRARRPAGRAGSARRRGRLHAASISSPTSARGSGARSTATAPVTIDAYRRNLQRAYIETLARPRQRAQAQSTTRARSSAAS